MCSMFGLDSVKCVHVYKKKQRDLYTRDSDVTGEYKHKWERKMSFEK